MSRRAACYLSLILCVACGGSSPVAPPDGGAVDPADAGVAIVDGSIEGAIDGDIDGFPIDTPCEDPCAIRWRELAPLDQPIDHHSTFILERDDGAYLYVLGGIRADPFSGGVASWSPRLMSAHIEEDGTLGPWHSQDFGMGIAFHAQAQYVDPDGRDTVLWIGGMWIDGSTTPPAIGTNPYTVFGKWRAGSGPGTESIFLGEDADDLGRTVGELETVVAHGTAALRSIAGDRDLFLVGGTDGETASADTRRYDLETDTWVLDAPLPTPRTHHAMVLDDDRLIVLGGFSGTNAAPDPVSTILRSVHDETGAITGWDEIGTLDDPPWTASSFVHDGHLYLVGGGRGGGHHGDSGFLDRVRRAPIEEGGTIGAFTDVSRLPLARGHVHQTPVHRGYVYSVGGRFDAGGRPDATPRVFVGTFED
jgi:hypothetical protein